MIWVLNALLIGLLLGYLAAEKMGAGLQVVFQFAADPPRHTRTVGVLVRTRMCPT